MENELTSSPKSSLNNLYGAIYLSHCAEKQLAFYKITLLYHALMARLLSHGAIL